MTPVPIKPEIGIDVLGQIDIRIGTIKAVSEVPNSDKLVALRVSFGDHERTILSGMKQERADLSVLVGKQALFVVNLKTRKMAGIPSEGMLFDIGYADGILPALAMPERPVPDGARAG
ncbi:MAG: tRNA-binding protein [Proteobacteria bacterium]|nr:tRNA-binding protein [Pseudomonadota bacterium]